MDKRAAGDGTVAKALSVMDEVAGFGRPVRFAELLDRSPYPKATLYRFVQVLTRQGMLHFDPDRQTYAPGLRLVRLAHAAWQSSALAPIARPHVDALSEAVGETVHLAQLDGAQVLYVDKRNARQPIEMYSAAGKIGPAYCTGVGKAMLAFLPEDQLAEAIAQQSFHRFTPRTLTTEAALRADLADIRARGFAWDKEEHEPGIICLAHPILTRAGRVLGAISVTSSTARETLEGLEKHLPRISAAAGAIAAEAQDWRFPDAAE
ncbi:MAG: IclR family transcriptional regulator [Rhodobacteraceae bacterium]|nr:IclR family transcriptional regulator [Paracoccaceae bacterium]